MFRRAFNFQDDKPQQQRAAVPNYATRSYILQANVPLTLPPARQYVLLISTVDDDAVGLSLGDGNADFGAWPLGIAVRVNAPTKTRIISTVAQSVTIIFSNGDVTLEDNRPPVYPLAGTTSLTLSTGAAGTTVVVTAAANVRGIKVQQFVGSGRASGVAPVAFSLVMNGATIAFSFLVPIGSAEAVPFTMPQPILVPPATELSLFNSQSTVIIALVVYKIL